MNDSAEEVICPLGFCFRGVTSNLGLTFRATYRPFLWGLFVFSGTYLAAILWLRGLK